MEKNKPGWEVRLLCCLGWSRKVSQIWWHWSRVLEEGSEGSETCIPGRCVCVCVCVCVCGQRKPRMAAGNHWGVERQVIVIGGASCVWWLLSNFPVHEDHPRPFKNLHVQLILLIQLCGVETLVASGFQSPPGDSIVQPWLRTSSEEPEGHC